MKNKTKFASIVLFLLASIMLASYGSQKFEWKGKVEKENGTKVVKNPTEPLYGEISFELEEDLTIGSEEDDNAYFYRGFAFSVDIEGNIYVFDRANLRIQKFSKNGDYLQTLGRRGQGPGEFQDFSSRLYIDKECNLYVRGRRRIHVFNEKGGFERSIPLDRGITKFGIIGRENILGETSSRNAKGRIREIVFLNSKGEKVRILTSLLRPRVDLKAKTNIFFSHPYGQNIYFCVLDENLGVYGNSSEYKLFVINSSGAPVYIIEKEEFPQKITRKEKNIPIDEFIKAYKKQDIKMPRGEIEKLSNLLEYKPFFNGILTDDLGHIYVKKVGSILVKENEVIYDLFHRDGYFLYRVRMPYLKESPVLIPSMIIRNGFIYRGEHDRETMLDSVKRYKIENWDEIKDGI